MTLELRLERPEDHRAVEILTYKAFCDLQLPGRTHCDEHFLVHRMRQQPAFVAELDFVAEMDGQLVGHIMYSQGKIIDELGNEYTVLTGGPLSVLPHHQKSGIGARLIRHSIEAARDLHYRAVLIFGHPDYYPRFGFRKAQTYGITAAEGGDSDAFMALELYPDALRGIEGRFYYDPVFHLDPDELARFNDAFPWDEV